VNNKKEAKTDTKAATGEKRTVKRATGTAGAKKASAELAVPVRPERTPAAAPLHLVEAPSGKAFWVNFGPIVSNLRDLREALATGISDQQFTHHVTGSRNDFAAWVEDVLCDASCAAALRRAKTREAAVRAVETALKRYA